MDKIQFEKLFSKAVEDSFSILNDETDQIIEEMIDSFETNFSEREKEILTISLRHSYLNQTILKESLEKLFVDE